MKTYIQIDRQMTLIAGWQDAPLVLKDLAKTICKIKIHAPHHFEHKFHNNK